MSSDEATIIDIQEELPKEPPTSNDIQEELPEKAPISGESTSFTHYTLVKFWFSPHRLQFIPTLRYLWFSAKALLLGIPFSFFALLILTSALRQLDLALLCIGMIFGFPGLVFVRLGLSQALTMFTVRTVFDKNVGYYWRGRRAPRFEYTGAIPPCFRIVVDDNFTKYELLDEIHALQIIPNESEFFQAYELNLILENGSRRHIFAHGNKRKLRKDAKKLAEFLDVPLQNFS